MTNDSRFTSLLTEMLDGLPTAAPDRLLASILQDVQGTPQHRRWGWLDRVQKGTQMSLILRATAVAAVIAIAAFMGLHFANLTPSVGGPSSPVPTQTPTFDCGTRIPSGAQVVQVTATDTELHLDPSTVRAGDVYLVLNPSAESVDFISELPPDFQTGGRDRLPLSDDQIASIRQIGSAQGTSHDGFSVEGCGNVFKVTVFAGNYALLIDLNQGGGGAPIPALLLVAVLEVLP